MSAISEMTHWKGLPLTRTWILTDAVNEYAPITQCHGVCFDDAGRILIIREDNQDWHLAGGTPEQGESLEETLKREAVEEADVRIDSVQPLGVLEISFPNNPKDSEGELFYQARFVCRAAEVMPQTPDPDGGRIWERKFVSPDEVGFYVKWGKMGEALFRDAAGKWRGGS